MNIPIYQVDAFTSKVFSGNPAAVCLLDSWLPDETLQKIAAENNLSETAFLVGAGGGFTLRWFTPTVEVALCGHATLAAAFVLFEMRKWPGDAIVFQTRSSGPLTVTRDNGLLAMDFPARLPKAIAGVAMVEQALGVRAKSVLGSAEDVLVVVDGEQAVRRLRPDMTLLEKVDCRGIIVTARGEDCDFVSRFFAPRVGVPEDPVTGSAHCVLAPYWAGVLGKSELLARQVSKRGGVLWCCADGDRVRIRGNAVPYLEGTLKL